MLVYVSYATPESQTVIEVDSASTVTAAEAIFNSGVLDKHSELKNAPLSIGIYGKKCALDTALKEFDRVEIYRPLLLTPVAARRLRANNVKNKSTK